jgi:4-amino-4-deoxy-L-arabinose transferase-like glycosyltransferase
LEVGGWVRWIKLAVLLAGIIYVISLWFYRENGFKGLADGKVMEQAQIAREVVRGNGFNTKMIRPAAMWQYTTRKGSVPVENLKDTYHAPIPILVQAGVFKAMDGLNDMFTNMSKNGWKAFDSFIYEKEMSPRTIVYAYDKMVAFTQVIFFLLAVFVNYFVAKRLFDRRLALMGMGLMLLCDTFWQYTMSGLPQMILLFLFGCATYCLARAVELRTAELAPVPTAADVEEGFEREEIVHEEHATVPVKHGFFARVGESQIFWLSLSALCFGLLALTHALAIWPFLGALLFVGFYFRPIGKAVAIMAAIFMVVYGPWMIRNYQVCGSPVGLGWYSALFQVRGTEGAVMRSMDPPLNGVSPTVYRDKVQNQILGQLSNILGYLGRVVVAPVFFLTLLHLFRRRDTSAFRWCVMLMWLAALFGMAVFGLEGTPIDANNLHILFIPLMTFYGLAFVLVLWSRWEIRVPLVRFLFLAFLFILSSLSFITNFVELHTGAKGRVQWPPYVPPYIAILGQWTTPREMIASDMPWAVAWYADRTSLWLPMNLKTFIELNDYNVLQKPIVGLYFTPVSGNAGFIRDIVKGDYREWAPFIMRNANMKNFPLRAVTALPIDNECVFYADRDRWSVRED